MATTAAEVEDEKKRKQATLAVAYNALAVCCMSAASPAWGMQSSC
jgi:hypothetical protein